MLAGPKGQNRQPPLRFKRQCTECTAWKLTLSWSLLRTVRECMLVFAQNLNHITKFTMTGCVCKHCETTDRPTNRN
jgi:hypothetical protein